MNKHFKSVNYYPAVWVKMCGKYSKTDWLADCEVISKKFDCDISPNHLWTIPFECGIIVTNRCPGILEISNNLYVKFYETQGGEVSKLSEGALWEILEDFNYEFDITTLECHKSIDDLSNKYFT